MTTNEAAERLRHAMMENMGDWSGYRDLVNAALAAERRATVERIAALVEGWYVSGRLVNRKQVEHLRRIILDEEAAR